MERFFFFLPALELSIQTTRADLPFSSVVVFDSFVLMASLPLALFLIQIQMSSTCNLSRTLYCDGSRGLRNTSHATGYLRRYLDMFSKVSAP